MAGIHAAEAMENLCPMLVPNARKGLERKPDVEATIQPLRATAEISW